MANYLCSVIGDAPKWNVTTEHSITETALVELERLFEENPELAEELEGLIFEALKKKE